VNHFFQELKDRGVIRVAGLYGAVVWLLLQASDVLFPAFDIPDSAVKILLAGCIVVFPVVMAFAWFYEITDRGIQLEEDVRKTGATRLMAGNEMYFIIIGILGIALSISVWMNFQSSELLVQEEQQPVSVLIADFDNQTKDRIFDGSVEEALTIGMEGASFISSYNRTRALDIANKLNSGDKLSEERARLVAVREGINLVLSGSISKEANEYLLKLRAVDPRNGEIVSDVEAVAEGKLEVLQAVGSLATQVREDFGDVGSDVEGAIETFTTASLEAMQFYSQAQSEAMAGNLEVAAELYEKATLEDDQFGRAYSGWALVEFQRGRTEQAEHLWETTLTHLQGMTDREKFRTMGIYYTRVSRNYTKAIENYEQLVEAYPADVAGRSNLAVSYFMNRQFEQAFQAGQAVAELYPNQTTLQSNHALYAMYAGDFQAAEQVATALAANEESYYKVHLPIAVAHLEDGDYEKALASYARMKARGDRGQSLSYMGMADVELMRGDFTTAVSLLEEGIEFDDSTGSAYQKNSKSVSLANAYAQMGEAEKAIEALNSVSASTSLTHMVSSALLYAELGEVEKAGQIAKVLAGKLQPEQRAYGLLIEGVLARLDQRNAEAIDVLQESLKKTDTWLGRLELGKAYLAGGANAEALSEFEACLERKGEATALFLDDIPTYHQVVDVYYWLGLSQQELGMVAGAMKNYSFLVDQKSDLDKSALTEDARSRLGILQSAAKTGN
jgi:tetratricopeptide (TPR) repeat protein